MGTRELLRRYEAGEHEGVWAELTALGAKGREAPHFDDAWAVARETMRRARHNVEHIIRRLDAMGYRFWDGKQGKPKGPPSRVTFGDKVIEASPLEALLAAMFEEARRLPLARITPVMLDQLRNMHQLAMYPWQDRALLLKGQRFSVDAELRMLFDQAKRAAPGQLATATIERLHALHLGAFAQAADYWRQKGEDPPALREKKAAEERQRQELQATDHRADKRVFRAPAKKEVAIVRKLEKAGVFLPLSLRAWIEEVGRVNLAGAHPRLCSWADESSGTYADPLMVVPDMVELEAWHDQNEGEALDWVIGWDARSKARLALDDEQLDYGYSVTLPEAAADPPLKAGPRNTTFVGYLRSAFRYGGFPGWEAQKDRPETELAALRDGLLPL
jgi:hypothetical protein